MVPLIPTDYGLQTRRFGILAHPVRQSLSPTMQLAAFKAANIDATFEAFDVEPGKLANFLKTHGEIEGLAVSMPHKEEVGEYLDGVDDTAKAIGAVNTVYTKDGKRLGTNTDARGFLRAIKEVMPELRGKRVLIVGAGGAARAIIYVLKPLVDSITLINRTVIKGVQLAKEFGVRYGGKLEDLITETPDLIVNATSVGMPGHDDPEIIPQDFLKPNVVVFDIVYHPGHTTHLIEEAKKAGATTVTGETMLLYQGVLQFELWTGKKAPEAVMREALG